MLRPVPTTSLGFCSWKMLPLFVVVYAALARVVAAAPSFRRANTEFDERLLV